MVNQQGVGMLVLFLVVCSFGLSFGTNDCVDHYDCKKCDEIKRKGQCSTYAAFCKKTCTGCAPYADQPYQPCADVKSKGECFKPIGVYNNNLWATVCEKTCCVLDTPPKWSEWTDWTPCSRSCHYGLKSRTRECIGAGFGQSCDGPALETAKCNENVPCQGLIGWDETSVDVGECAGTVTVKITRTRVTNCEASFKVSTKDGSAVQPGDYKPINDQVITFLKDETVKSVTFTINGDTEIEGPESFEAYITADPKKLEIKEPKCTINIKDQSAKIGFKPDKYEVNENDNSVKVIVHRDGNKNGQNKCSVSTMDATATSPADYQGLTDFAVVFEAGQDIKEIEISIVDDSLVENDEIFKLSLKCEESPCTKVVPNQAVVVIKSDDVDGGWSPWSPYGECDKKCGNGTQSRSRTCTNPAPQGEGKQCEGKSQSSQACNTHHCPGEVGWDQITAELDECHGTVKVKVVRSKTTYIPASISITLNPGTASDEDYASLDNNKVEFKAGETEAYVVFKAKADNVIEPDESFTAVITADNAADLTVAAGKGTCTLTIKDQSALIKLEKPSYSASENDGSVTVKVVRTGNNNGKNVCKLNSADGSAVGGQDFEAVTNFPVVFEAGDDSQSVEIKITDDNEQESTEKFTLSLTCDDPECVKVEGAEVEITDDDIDGGWSPWSPYGECDKKCGGGTQSRSRTCTNPAPQGEGKQCEGESQSSQPCNIYHCPIDGNWTEWSPWSTPTRTCGGATKYRTRTCTNPAPQYGGKDCEGKDKEIQECNADPCPAKVGLKPEHQTVPEDVGKVKVTIFRVGNSIGTNKVIVSTVPKDAQSPDDYTEIPETEITFAPGEDLKAVMITIIDDKKPESDEVFEVKLKSNDANVISVHPDVATIKIIDNDVKLSLKPVTKSVRESDGFVEFTIVRTGSIKGETTAILNTCELGSAKAGEDFEALTDFEVKFAPKETEKTFKIKIIDDQLIEDKEYFCVELTSNDKDICEIEPNKAKIYIIDDDVKLSLQPKTTDVLENKGYVTLSVKRYGNLKVTTKAVIDTEDNTAIANKDYKPRTGFTLEFQPDESVKYFKVMIIDDNIPEPTENFKVKLSSPDAHVTVINPDLSVVNILDSDAKIGFEKVKYYFNENAGVVKVALVRSGALNVEHTVVVKSEDDTATQPSDYDNVYQKITFKKDETRVEFDVKINNDNKEEGKETFRLKLSTSDSRVLLDPEVATVCIVDNDVDGKWGPWSSYSQCGKTCGESTKTRTRTCDNPAPAGEGAPCEGEDKQTIKCYVVQYCPINGGFSEWSDWSKCSVSCGGGHSQRTRTCTNPAPQYGGRPCIGSPIEVKDCNQKCCPVNGMWGEWSKWSTCSITCVSDSQSYGHQTRTRKCDSPAPSCEGAQCYGGDAAATEKRKCMAYTPCSQVYVVPMAINPYATTQPPTQPPTTTQATSPYEPQTTTQAPNPYEPQTTTQPPNPYGKK